MICATVRLYLLASDMSCVSFSGDLADSMASRATLPSGLYAVSVMLFCCKYVRSFSLIEVWMALDLIGDRPYITIAQYTIDLSFIMVVHTNRTYQPTRHQLLHGTPRVLQIDPLVVSIRVCVILCEFVGQWIAAIHTFECYGPVYEVQVDVRCAEFGQ